MRPLDGVPLLALQHLFGIAAFFELPAFLCLLVLAASLLAVIVFARLFRALFRLPDDAGLLDFADTCFRLVVL